MITISQRVRLYPANAPPNLSPGLSGRPVLTDMKVWRESYGVEVEVEVETDYGGRWGGSEAIPGVCWLTSPLIWTSWLWVFTPPVSSTQGFMLSSLLLYSVSDCLTCL